MIVLDACVLIAHLTTDDSHHDRATRLLIGLAGQPKAMSVLTRAEVLVVPARAGRRRVAEDVLDRLRIDVLLTAELNSPAELATFDERLARAATERGVIVRADS